MDSMMSEPASIRFANRGMPISQVQRERDALRAEVERLNSALDMLAEEREAWKALAQQLRAALELLEHPSGRLCPWCLTPTDFPHHQHCELAKMLTRHKCRYDR